MRAKSWGGTCPSKKWDHTHTDGTQSGRNHEVALVLQRAISRTYWWHTKRPKSWGGTCPSKSEITYRLMAHKEAEIVRCHLSFNERDHVHPDGTRRDRNCEVALVLQRARLRTSWWHTKRPKLWGVTCPSKCKITYILMAHEETEIVRWLSFKEQDHVHPDGTQRGRNRDVALVLQWARSHTYWWHTKRPKSWGGTCPSKSKITYILMAHEETEIVRCHLSFKERDHVQADGTQRDRNHEVALVLQRARSRTY